MKKKEFDFEKFQKDKKDLCVNMAPNWFIGYGWLIALVLCALVKDLQIILHVEFTYFYAMLGLVFAISISFCFSWLICLVYYAIATFYYKKKYPQYDFSIKGKDELNSAYVEAKTKWLHICISRAEKKEEVKDHEDK